jgi:hypothetical protein
VESAGFAVEHWNDLTERAASMMRYSWRYHPTRSDCTPSFPTLLKTPGTSSSL